MKAFCFGGKQSFPLPETALNHFFPHSLRFKGHREQAKALLAACPAAWEPVHAPRVKYQLFSLAAFPALSWEGGLCQRFWLITVRTNKHWTCQSRAIGKKKGEVSILFEKGEEEWGVFSFLKTKFLYQDTDSTPLMAGRG